MEREENKSARIWKKYFYKDSEKVNEDTETKEKKSRERKIEINHLHPVSIKRYMQFRKKRLSIETEKLDLSEKYRICQLS